MLALHVQESAIEMALVERAQQARLWSDKTRDRNNVGSRWLFWQLASASCHTYEANCYASSGLTAVDLFHPQEVLARS